MAAKSAGPRVSQENDMQRRFWIAAVALLGAASCVIVVPKDGDGGPYVPPPTLRAQMLIQVNLDPSVVNMASAYSQLIRTYQGVLALQTPRVWIDQIAIMPLNRSTTSGPRLIYAEDLSAGLEEFDAKLAEGKKTSALEAPNSNPDIGNIPSPAIGEGRLMSQLLQAALAAEYLEEEPNRAEHQNLAEIGQSISTQFVYAPDGSDTGAAPPFAGPKDLFIVLTINHLKRHCALGDAACQLNGQSPTSYFSAKDSNGHAAWLNFGNGLGLPPQRVFHISVSTQEGATGEAFFKRCSETAGFPPNFVDLIEPSSAKYYDPFASDLSGSKAYSEDFCTMLGRDGVVHAVLNAYSLAGSL
jgi:hypothetical protein